MRVCSRSRGSIVTISTLRSFEQRERSAVAPTNEMSFRKLVPRFHVDVREGRTFTPVNRKILEVFLDSSDNTRLRHPKQYKFLVFLLHIGKVIDEGSHALEWPQNQSPAQGVGKGRYRLFVVHEKKYLVYLEVSEKGETSK